MLKPDTNKKLEPEKTKKIGIAFDDYKEQHYKKELNARGMRDFTVGPGVTPDTRSAIIIVDAADFAAKKEEIRRMCVKLEISKPWKN